MEVRGYVIRITPYKEKNSMVTVLTKDGTISFLARGNLAINSKNSASLTLFSESSFELTESKSGHMSLKSGQLIDGHSSFFKDLTILTSLSLIGEVLVKCLDDNNGSLLYPHFKKALWQLENRSNPLSTVAVFFINCLQVHGLSFNVNHCVHCQQKTKIVAFSYLEGGFICLKCYNPDKYQNYSQNYLLAIRYLFLNKDQDSILKELSLKDIFQIINELTVVFNEQLGITIKGQELLFKSII